MGLLLIGLRLRGAAPLLVLPRPTLLLLVRLLHVLVVVVPAATVAADPVTPAVTAPIVIRVAPVPSSVVRAVVGVVIIAITAAISGLGVVPAPVRAVPPVPLIVPAASVVLVVVTPTRGKGMNPSAIVRVAAPPVATAPAVRVTIDPEPTNRPAALLGHRRLDQMPGVVALPLGTVDLNRANLTTRGVGLTDRDPRAGFATDRGDVGTRLADDPAGPLRVNLESHANLAAAAAAAVGAGRGALVPVPAAAAPAAAVGVVAPSAVAARAVTSGRPAFLPLALLLLLEISLLDVWGVDQK
mmetsp:Transcript_10870/g.50194  ORF Transcript_10870/g.50194 Transcript_10870/m.50194 type:complete len:298 (+) Transcript_10870:1077-1970(+)